MSDRAETILPAAQNLLLSCEQGLSDLLMDELTALAGLCNAITDQALTELVARQQARP